MKAKNKKLAQENYKQFSAFDGSDYIASEFALETIVNILDSFNITSVLELGLGIGSVSDTILKYNRLNKKEILYYGTENNVFCLDALKKNVKDFDKINLFSELKEIKNQKFDLIIVDGQDVSLSIIETYTKSNTIFYVEGDRSNQTEALKEIFPKSKHVNVITLRKNPEYAHGGNSTNNYLGGGQVIFKKPTSKMKYYFLKEKIRTFVIRKLRSYKKKV
jgi:spore coat polysaccharide biosynthesis predicted glycosyltransferase SpsG